jgi:hypothetical protein
MLRAKKFEIRKKIGKAVKADKTKQSAMKLSQLRRKIELCMREIILWFEMDL